MSETRATYLTKESTMSTDLDLATLDHWFGWMRNSESWRREREIVYGMWAELERLRDELLTFRLGKHHAQNAELKAEIERLRAELKKQPAESLVMLDLKEQLMSKNAELKRLSLELGGARAEIERLRAELGRMVRRASGIHGIN